MQDLPVAAKTYGVQHGAAEVGQLRFQGLDLVKAVIGFSVSQHCHQGNPLVAQCRGVIGLDVQRLQSQSQRFFRPLEAEQRGAGVGQEDRVVGLNAQGLADVLEAAGWVVDL